MCSRYPYRLAWRDKAFKINRNFQTHYWMPSDTYCCTYAPPDHFNGIGDDNVWQHVVSKIYRLNELKFVIMEQCSCNPQQIPQQCRTTGVCCSYNKHVTIKLLLLLLWSIKFNHAFKISTLGITKGSTIFRGGLGEYPPVERDVRGNWD